MILLLHAMSSITFSQTSGLFDAKVLSNHSTSSINDYNTNKSTMMTIDNVTIYRQDAIKSNVSNNFTNNIVNDGKNGMTIKRSTASPIEIGHIISMAIILSILVMLGKFSRIIISLRKRYNFFVKVNGDGGMPKSYRYKNVREKEQIIPIANNVSNNIKTLITIYGILLSFMIANQLSIASRSLTFAIWSGWILATIIRGGQFGYILSDIWETEQNLETAKEKIVSANLYYKRATYLFIPILALTPAFFFISDDKPAYQWNTSVSILSIALGIVIVTMIFYLYSSELEGRYTGNGGIMIICLSFVAAIIFSLNTSLLSEKYVMFFGVYSLYIPIVWLALPIVILFFTGPYFLFYYALPLGNYFYSRFLKTSFNKRNKKL